MSRNGMKQPNTEHGINNNRNNNSNNNNNFNNNNNYSNKFEYLCRITLQYYGTVINGVLLTKKIYMKKMITRKLLCKVRYIIYFLVQIHISVDTFFIRA